MSRRFHKDVIRRRHKNRKQSLNMRNVTNKKKGIDFSIVIKKPKHLAVSDIEDIDYTLITNLMH